jgi:hypothetical protein
MLENFVKYIKQEWKNKPDTSTPLSADRLNHIEGGVKTNSDAINEIITGVANYSSDETECGTWKGKPLYRRILELTDATDRKNYDFKKIIGSVTVVKTVGHTAQPNGNFVPLPYYLNDRDYAAYYISSSLLFTYRCGGSYGAGDVELEVYYTK